MSTSIMSKFHYRRFTNKHRDARVKGRTESDLYRWSILGSASSEKRILVLSYLASIQRTSQGSVRHVATFDGFLPGQPALWAHLSEQ